jgi:hypothetical protein
MPLGVFSVLNPEQINETYSIIYSHDCMDLPSISIAQVKSKPVLKKQINEHLMAQRLSPI